MRLLIFTYVNQFHNYLFQVYRRTMKIIYLLIVRQFFWTTLVDCSGRWRLLREQHELKTPQEEPLRSTAFASKSDSVGSTGQECLNFCKEHRN